MVGSQVFPSDIAERISRPKTFHTYTANILYFSSGTSIA